MEHEHEDMNEMREQSNPQDIVFMDTALILKAMEGMQKSQSDFRALLEQAELGDTSVYHDLAVRYAKGDGVEENMERAAHWFAQSADLGGLRSVEALGRCYQTGGGVERDEARAF